MNGEKENLFFAISHNVCTTPSIAQIRTRSVNNTLVVYCDIATFDGHIVNFVDCFINICDESMRFLTTSSKWSMRLRREAKADSDTKILLLLIKQMNEQQRVEYSKRGRKKKLFVTERI
jgi:hypothetical protein